MLSPKSCPRGPRRAADLPHAFGGALALAFCTSDPCGTQDIDVDVFLAPAEVGGVVAALPDGDDEQRARFFERVADAVPGIS